MAIGHRVYEYFKSTHGTIHHKNLYSNSFGYTETRKKVSAPSNADVHAAITGTTSAQTVTTGFTDPDVPRGLKLVFGGTTADIAACTITVHGTNVEGKPIYEEFAVSANQSANIEGNKAFKTVSKIHIPAQDGTAGTISVGTTDKIGVNHRLKPSETTVKVYSSTSVANRIPPTLQGAPTVAANDNSIELNTVTPATANDGTTFLSILYTYDEWATAPVNDQPVYTDATTTSTSTTTITTTTTTSTSTSTSSTSTSTSSTSTSTSSTSTSTTTIP